MASEAKPRCGQDVGRVEMLADMIPSTKDNEESTDGEMPDLVYSEPEAYHFPLKRKTRPRTRRLTKLDFNESGKRMQQGHAGGQPRTRRLMQLDFMEICHRMHMAMLLDNRENVLKAARMNGWVSHRPTQNGLVPLAGDGRRDFLLGSSRLLQETVFLKGPACHSTSDPPPLPDERFFSNRMNCFPTKLSRFPTNNSSLVFKNESFSNKNGSFSQRIGRFLTEWAVFQPKWVVFQPQHVFSIFHMLFQVFGVDYKVFCARCTMLRSFVICICN